MCSSVKYHTVILRVGLWTKYSDQCSGTELICMLVPNPKIEFASQFDCDERGVVFPDEIINSLACDLTKLYVQEKLVRSKKNKKGRKYECSGLL